MRIRIAYYSILIILLVLAIGSSAWTVYGVRISDLTNTPLPPNPVKVWGKVTSSSPVKISDGSAEVVVNGITAAVGDFLVVTGDWDGSTITVNGPVTGRMDPAGIDMVYVPAGDFLMGSNGDEPMWESNERPQHTVYLSSYYIGKYEVTRGQYRQFMNAGGYTKSSYWSSEGWSWKVANGRKMPEYWTANQNWGTGTFTQTDNHPVVGVSYYEAEAFCRWAGGHLPTEAQWEKASRWTGTHSNIYPWGDVWDVEKCNNYNDHNVAAGGYQKKQTSPVGSYPGNVSPYGCQDMAANVMEWCQDWYDPAYYSQSPASDPQGPSSGSFRNIRSSYWGDYSNKYERCADRDGYYPYGYLNGCGFRMAR